MMVDGKRLENARENAAFILELSDAEIAKFFYRESMRRGLSRLVRDLDLLVQYHGEDRKIGARALQRLGFEVEE